MTQPSDNLSPCPQSKLSVTLQCPACGSNDVSIFDRIDFNRNCVDKPCDTPPSGKLIEYDRCSSCGFLFAPEICSWPKEFFEQQIYNAEYERVDPDYKGVRSQQNFRFLKRNFQRQKDKLRHLDYGGGDGNLSQLLKEDGFNSDSYEPFSDDTRFPGTRYNLITAFEVFEHVPDPNQLMRNLSSLLSDRGIIIFTTALSDNKVTLNKPLSWDYAAPRNGHICLFSSRSLATLANRYGFKFLTLKNGKHVFWKSKPKWAQVYFYSNSRNFIVRNSFKLLAKLRLV